MIHVNTRTLLLLPIIELYIWICSCLIFNWQLIIIEKKPFFASLHFSTKFRLVLFLFYKSCKLYCDVCHYHLPATYECMHAAGCFLIINTRIRLPFSLVLFKYISRHDKESWAIVWSSTRWEMIIYKQCTISPSSSKSYFADLRFHWNCMFDSVGFH